ncbi:MAG: radical SAM protein [Bacteroidales bacterium]|nr:radical SAM protein [Bacteroidales bacterium]
MKKSNYNHHFEQGQFSYWYNALTNSFFRLTLSTGRHLQEYIESSEMIGEIESQLPSLYEKLSKGGFIIEDTKDEYGEIVKRAERASNDKNAFLIIVPTLNCNYACWYCIQDHIPSLMSDETIERVKRHIDYMIREQGITSLHIDWFGGEPLMFFDKVVEPISAYAKERCEEVDIPFINSATTNGFFLTKDKLEKLKELNFNNFQITLDGNKENHDKVKFMNNLDSSFDHALRNINQLLHYNVEMRMLLRINYTHDNITNEIVDQVCERLDSDIRARITILPRKVWQENVDREFGIPLREILQKFENAGFIINYWEPMVAGVPCYVSKKLHKTINYNGYILKCTASDDLYATTPKGYIKEDGSESWEEEYYGDYTSPTFLNERCQPCRYLPVCYGQCPRNNLQCKNACKMDGQDTSFESNIIAFIDQHYKHADFNQYK